jgi:predicted MFS family arabinose efflux permease
MPADDEVAHNQCHGLEPEPKDEHSPSRKFITGLVFFSAFIDGLSIAIQWPILPYLGKDIGATTAQVGTVFALFPGGSILGMPFTGWLADTFGRKAAVLYSLGFTGLYTLAFCLVKSPTGLMVGSFVGGLAGSTYPVARAVLGDMYETDELPQMFAWMSMALTMPYIIGPFIAGKLAALTSPVLLPFVNRLPFALVSALSFVTFALVAVYMVDTRRPPASSEQEEEGDSASSASGREEQKARAMRDIWRNPAHAFLCLVSSFLSMGIHNAFLSSFTPFLVEIFDWGVGATSNAFALFSGTYLFFASVVASWDIISKLGLETSTLVGSVGVIGAHLMLYSAGGDYLAHTLALGLLGTAMLLWSSGKNVVDPSFYSMSADAVPLEVSGFFQGVVSAIGALGQSVLTWEYHFVAERTSYRTSLGANALTAGTMGFVLLALYRVRQAKRRKEEPVAFLI